jgi:RNA polymerase sigma-70 factor, ECF subfamily
MSQIDSARFVQLLTKHQNDLLRFITPLVGCLEDAEEILQQTAMLLWQKADQYDPQQAFLPWARQFAKYEVLKRRHERQRYTFLTEELIETLAEQQAEQDSLASKRRLVLHNCVAALPERDRLLLKHRYDRRGTTIGQLAIATGQTANALYKALQRIRGQLLLCVNRKLAAVEA